MIIKRKIKECKGCNKEKEIFYVKGQLCLFCNINRNRKKWVKASEDRLKNTPIGREKMQTLYRKFWDDSPKKECYECGCKLTEFRSWNVNHIIQKHLWKKYLPADIVHDYKYIRLVCLQCHSSYDNGNKEQTPKMLELYNQLISEFN